MGNLQANIHVGLTSNLMSPDAFSEFRSQNGQKLRWRPGLPRTPRGAYTVLSRPALAGPWGKGMGRENDVEERRGGEWDKCGPSFIRFASGSSWMSLWLYLVSFLRYSMSINVATLKSQSISQSRSLKVASFDRLCMVSY